MIELALSESSAGSLTLAQERGFLPKENHIVCLPYRLEIRDLNSFPPFQGEAEQKKLSSYRQDFMEALLHHQEIRIWYSHAPREYCGFLHACSLMENTKISIRAIQAHERLDLGKQRYVEFSSCSEVAPEYIPLLLTKQKELTISDKENYIQIWKKLEQENAPLRVVKNEMLFSAPLDYYDSELLLHLKRWNEVRVSELLNSFTSERYRGISFDFLPSRVHWLIEQGSIQIIQKEPHFCNAKIRAC